MMFVSLKICLLSLILILDWGLIPILSQLTTLEPLEIEETIFGGDPVEVDEISIVKHQFPHIAVLGYANENRSEIKWFCGGSLIAKNWILTAAHCSKSKLPNIVRLGLFRTSTNDSDDRYKWVQEYSITQIIRHPEYSGKFHYNDIALYRINGTANFTEYVVPACLWTDDEEIKPNVILHASGFGQVVTAGGFAGNLSKIQLQISPLQDCASRYKETENRRLPQGLINSHLCTIDPNFTNKSTCNGDSGGPLEIKLKYFEFKVAYLVGITAFGANICGSNVQSVYTRISSFINWIKKYVLIETDPLKCAEKYFDYFPSRRVSPKLPERGIMGEEVDKSCTVTPLSRNFLLASAECLSELSNPNRMVNPKKKDNMKILIKNISYHEKFDPEFPYKYDIAIVELEEKLKNKIIDDIHNQNCQNQMTITIKAREHFGKTYQKAILSIEKRDLQHCLDRYSRDILEFDEDIMCFDSGEQRVPDYCEIPPGTIIKAICNDGNKVSNTIIGMSVYSKDCGPIFALKMEKYIEWIDQVVLNEEQSTSTDIIIDTISTTTEAFNDIKDDSIHFIDDELELEDGCITPDGAIGSCMNRNECKTVSKTLLICGEVSENIICCSNSTLI